MDPGWHARGSDLCATVGEHGRAQREAAVRAEARPRRYARDVRADRRHRRAREVCHAVAAAGPGPAPGAAGPAAPRGRGAPHRGVGELPGRGGGELQHRGGAGLRPPERRQGLRGVPPRGRPGRRHHQRHDGGAHTEGGRAKMRHPHGTDARRDRPAVARPLVRGVLVHLVPLRLRRADELLRRERAARPAGHVRRRGGAARG
mmetsp:Transcript_74108/g.209264  ORF Transcript_74108/g.209264 Transcript_74108/m.209264 type:complete len:203 (+) Transcript_74108:486-1094(+)